MLLLLCLSGSFLLSNLTTLSIDQKNILGLTYYIYKDYIKSTEMTTYI